MLLVECNGCRAKAFVDCKCPDGHNPGAVAGFIEGVPVPVGHHGTCPMADLGGTVTCEPGSDCCKLKHSHDAAANSCRETHEGHPCAHPDPARCPVWRNTEGDGPCPGGHHGLGVQDCSVCRPVTITVMPGSTNLQLAAGAAR